MKLIRHGQPGSEKPSILTEDGQRKDCSSHFTDWDRSFFQDGGLTKLHTIVTERFDELPDISTDIRWGSCVARPGKVICIGLNYSDHAAEAGMPEPSEPIVFMKASNTVIGPFDAIHIPRNSDKTDWEVELGVVISQDAKYLASPDEAANHIAGYCISHDVSERAFQLERGGQWTKGKSCDTFNPLGPFLATADEVPNPNNLTMKLRVNGEQKQNGNTSTMIFNPHFLVHYLSQFMTLEAGDLISTGTPPGVGMGSKPPRYLASGDVIELSIQHLGEQKQTCRDA